MTTDINKLLERLRTYYGDDLACRTLLMDARHALEALAGEVERLTSDVDALGDNLEKVVAERNRLKDALAPFAAIKADDGDTFDTWHDDVIIRCEITVRDLKQARAALGDAS